MIITYLGHSSLHIELKSCQIVVDPFITGNSLAEDIDVDKIEADYILLTHGHQDHILDVERIANNTGAQVIANYEIANYFSEKGLKTTGMNHGGHVKLDDCMVKMVSAVHTSSFPDGSYAGEPGGYVLYDETKSIYISGDTALSWDMKLLPLTCPPLDLAILSIGDHFTMGYRDALIAAQFVETDTVMGYHYDTFPPIAIDKEEVMKFFTKNGKGLLLPEIGEKVEI